MYLSTIKSISFSKKNPVACAVDPQDLEEENKDGTKKETKEPPNPFACSDFLVADSNGVVSRIEATMFQEIDRKKKRGTTLMRGVKAAISAIAVHPTVSLIAVAQDDGWIGIYDYMDDFKVRVY